MGKGKRLHDTPEDWTSLTGMPDDWDKKNITNLVNNFKREKFVVNERTVSGNQLILAVTATARKKQEMTTNAFNSDTGIRDKDSQYRTELSLPTILLNRILEAYPVILRDDRQYNWFVKNFPQFKVR